MIFFLFDKYLTTHKVFQLLLWAIFFWSCIEGFIFFDFFDRCQILYEFCALGLLVISLIILTLWIRFSTRFCAHTSFFQLFQLDLFSYLSINMFVRARSFCIYIRIIGCYLLFTCWIIIPEFFFFVYSHMPVINIWH